MKRELKVTTKLKIMRQFTVKTYFQWLLFIATYFGLRGHLPVIKIAYKILGRLIAILSFIK
jgi:hypothetical protein